MHPLVTRFTEAIQAPKSSLLAQRDVLDIFCEAKTKLSASTLQNWINRGLVNLVDNNPGRSGVRLYSVADLVNIHVMVKLSQLGVSAASAAEISADLSRFGLDALKNDEENEGFSRANEIIAIVTYKCGRLEANVETGIEQYIQSQVSSSIIKGTVENYGKNFSAVIADLLPDGRTIKPLPDYCIRISISASVNLVKFAMAKIAESYTRAAREALGGPDLPE